MPVPPAPPRYSPRQQWFLTVALALVPMFIGVLQLGRIHPDEVYQYLEPAMQKAFGFSVVAWEFKPESGLRNWAIPYVLTALLKLCALFGIEDVWSRRAVLELPLLALHLLAVRAVFLLLNRRMQSLALPGLVLFGLFAPVLHFAGRTLGESFSAAMLVCALEALEDPNARKRKSFAGGVWLGLSVVARYGSAPFAAGSVVWLLVQRRWRAALFATLGGLLIAALLGALDWATWGAPFHSLRAYIHFNVFSDEPVKQFGAEPFWFYFPQLLAWTGVFLAAAVYEFVRVRRVPPMVGLAPALLYVAAISATPHKEPRFLYPAMIVVAVSAMPSLLHALGHLVGELRARWVVLGLAAVSVGAWWAPTPMSPIRPEQFRAQAKASVGATGLIIVGEGVWGAGGFFYVGKNIPWFTCDFPEDPRFQSAMQQKEFNRAITWDKHAHEALIAGGFKVVEEIGPATRYARP